MKKIYIQAVFKYPKQILVLFSLMTLLALLFAVRVERDDSLDNLLPDTSETMAERQRIADLFNIKEGAVVGLRFRTDVFQPATIEFLAQVTQQLTQESQRWGLRAVRSLTTVDDLVLTGADELEDVNLYDYYQSQKEQFGEQRAIELLRQQVQGNPLLPGLIVSEDFHSAFIQIETDFDDQDTSAGTGLHQFLQQFFPAAAAQSQIDLERIDISGVPIISSTIAAYMGRDIGLLAGLAILILAILLWLYFGNVRGVVLPLLEVVASLIWTFGVMGLLAQRLTLIGIGLPVILMAVGIADDLYFLIKFDHFWRRDGDRRQAILQTMEQLFVAHIITSLTTAIGFLAFASSPLASVRQFAFFAALGVGFTLLFSLFLLPAMLLLLPLSPPQARAKRSLISTPLAKVVRGCQQRWVLPFTFVVLTLFVLLASWQLKVRFSGIELFKFNAPLRVADRSLNRDSGGTVVLYAHFSSQQSDLLNSADFLQRLEQLQLRLKNEPRVGYQVSLVDYLKRIQQIFSNDSSLSIDDETITQLLFLYEILDISLIENVSTADFNDLNLIVLIRENRSDAFKKVRSLIETEFSNSIEPVFGDDITLKFSGQGDFAIEIIDSIVRSQVVGIPLVLVSLLLLLLIVFRSLRAALVSVLPVAASLGLLFGVQALLGIPINLVTGLLAGIVAGLGIDYSIHLVTMLEQLRSPSAEEYQQQAKTLIDLSGNAVLLNALSLSVGFLALLGSNFAGVQQLGLMLGLCMSGTALVVLTTIPRFYLAPVARAKTKKRIGG